MFSRLKSAAAKLSGGSGKKRDYQVPANLTPAEQKEIQQIIGRASPDREVPHTAQESIPFERMFPDGICRVTENYYTKTIQFQDINYQLAQQEDKSATFDEWCSFLNFFDSSIKFELSFVNTATDVSDFARQVQIPPQNDGFNAVRAEYSSMLKRQLAQGNNGLTKRKYLTFGIEADSLKQARPRLAHIETDLISNFHRIGVITHVLDGKERLKLMHGMFHMGDPDKFYFDWKWLTESGLSVKDFIAPTAFAFPKSRLFQMGGIYGAVSYLQITASDLSDQLLKDFLDMESSQIVTMHIQSVDQNKAIKTIKHTITELDRSKIEEQKKAVRSGYDIDIIPSDLATYGKDAKALLKELQSQNERMFLLTFLVLNTGRTEQELETNVFQAVSIAQKHNCNLRRLDFQQEQGLMSSLPLAYNQIDIQRGMTTSSTAIFVPFTTQELFQTGKEALYYGLNALSNNLIMVDRKLLKNQNGLILETLGGREDLFSDVSFAVSTGEYTDYDIPGEALTDEKFANMIAEAEKYLGMAYVWGGSSPSTGFDCSGYVSWVINNCGNGWSVGRLTANGLMGICDIISADEAKPGDLIFFQGTYSTSGASHVGIYVGNGMMIHCGNPISYTSIETSYWQEHFYCFGRIRD